MLNGVRTTGTISQITFTKKREQVCSSVVDQNSSSHSVIKQQEYLLLNREHSGQKSVNFTDYFNKPQINSCTIYRTLWIGYFVYVDRIF